MATRREVAQRRSEMMAHLRAQCADGSLVPGQGAPSLRALSEEFGVSQRVVMEVMAQLIEERLFHTIERVGTFVGPPRGSVGGVRPLFVFVENPVTLVPRRQREIKQGFEYRIATLGGSVLTLPPEVSSQGCTGVFEWAPSHDPLPAQLPRVIYDDFAHLRTEPGPIGAPDSVSFDNEDGGEQATRHLMLNGHSRIAYLGLHGEISGQWPQWSRERQAGWRAALLSSGFADDSLAFNAPHGLTEPPGEEAQERLLGELALLASRDLIGRLYMDEISAVVAANDAAARVLIKQLRANGVPLERWPSIVGFDNELASRDQLMSSLYLPWDELGKQAANLLWERAMGQLDNVPLHREVRARLIPRLTCNTNWSLSPHHAVLATAQPQ